MHRSSRVCTSGQAAPRRLCRYWTVKSRFTHWRRSQRDAQSSASGRVGEAAMGARSIVQTVLVEALGQLEPVPERTIVINVNTDLVATRALLSAVEVVKGPLLLVSCDPTPQGRARFAALSEERGFDV